MRDRVGVFDPTVCRQIQVDDWQTYFKQCQGAVFVDSLPEDEIMGGAEEL